MGELYIIVRVGDGKIMASNLDYATASEKTTELSWKTRQRYAIVTQEDYNLPYTEADLQ